MCRRVAYISYSVYSFALTKDNCYLIAGASQEFNDTTSNDTSERSFLVKVSSNDTILWSKRYAPAQTVFNFVGVMNDNSILACGSIGTFLNTNFWVVKFDSAGNSIWHYQYESPHPQSATYVKYLTDSSLLIIGPRNDSGGIATHVFTLNQVVFDSTLATTRYERNPLSQSTNQSISIIAKSVRGAITFTYYIPQTSNMRLSIYGINGRLVKTFMSTVTQKGAYMITWNGRDMYGRALCSGSYFYKFEGMGQVFHGKLVIME